MKRISDRDADRIIAHIIKAAQIIQLAQEESDDGEICMDIDRAETCAGKVQEILIAINNTILD